MATTKLVELARAEADLVVIDTTGAISGVVGQTLKYHKMELCRPDVVVGLQRGGELEPLVGMLRRFFNGAVELTGADPEVRPASPEDRRARRAAAFAAAFAAPLERWRVRPTVFAPTLPAGLDLARLARVLVGLMDGSGRCRGLGSPGARGRHPAGADQHGRGHARPAPGLADHRSRHLGRPSSGPQRGHVRAGLAPHSLPRDGRRRRDAAERPAEGEAPPTHTPCGRDAAKAAEGSPPTHSLRARAPGGRLPLTPSRPRGKALPPEHAKAQGTSPTPFPALPQTRYSAGPAPWASHRRRYEVGPGASSSVVRSRGRLPGPIARRHLRPNDG